LVGQQPIEIESSVKGLPEGNLNSICLETLLIAQKPIEIEFRKITKDILFLVEKNPAKMNCRLTCLWIHTSLIRRRSMREKNGELRRKKRRDYFVIK
jgi:hypothetical protein